MAEATAVDHITMEAMAGSMIVAVIMAAIDTAAMATTTEDMINPNL